MSIDEKRLRLVGDTMRHDEELHNTMIEGQTEGRGRLRKTTSQKIRRRTEKLYVPEETRKSVKDMEGSCKTQVRVEYQRMRGGRGDCSSTFFL